MVISFFVGACKSSEKASHQSNTSGKDNNSTQTIIIGGHSNEVLPEIIGGQKELQRHLSYPVTAKKNKTQGIVVWRFTVTKKGTAKNFDLVHGIGDGCDQAAKRALQAVRFKPARENGKVVRVGFSWPINFALN